MTKDRIRDLVAWVEQGRIMEAMNEFYAHDAIMQDNQNPPTIGLPANLEREQAFVDSLAVVHECSAKQIVVEGDNAVVHWVLDFTKKDGTRVRLDQLAVQTWSDGKITSERFVYDSKNAVQAA